MNVGISDNPYSRVIDDIFKRTFVLNRVEFYQQHRVREAIQECTCGEGLELPFMSSVILTELLEAFGDINRQRRVNGNLPMRPKPALAIRVSDFGNTIMQIVDQRRASHLDPVGCHVLCVNCRLGGVDHEDAVGSRSLFGGLECGARKSRQRLNEAPYEEAAKSGHSTAPDKAEIFTSDMRAKVGCQEY